MRKLSYAGTELDALKDAKNYYRWILSHFAPYVGNRIVEVGAGTGTFSEFLLNGTNASELILIEPAENLFPLLEARFSGNSRVKLVHGSLEDLSTTSFSTESVVTVNVLEHIPKDEVFLQTAHRLLVPGGTLLLFVPALPQLFGTLDEVFGHVQRYTKPLLGRKLRRAGFHLVCLRYLNSIGVIPWFITNKALRRRTLRPADVRAYDRWVVPWLSKLERRWEPPLGQSLIAIAKKQD